MSIVCRRSLEVPQILAEAVCRKPVDAGKESKT